MQLGPREEPRCGTVNEAPTASAYSQPQGSRDGSRVAVSDSAWEGASDPFNPKGAAF
jgi:hypothetical protein